MASKLDKARKAVSTAVRAPGKKAGNKLANQLLPKKNLNGTPRKK